MKMYGRGQSRSFRGVWALLECGVTFDYVHVDPATLDFDYSTINSQSKVPTLTDGDLVLSESAAIVNYAGNLSGKFIPDDAAERAAYDNFCYFIMTDFEQPLWTMGKHRFALPEEQRQESILSTALFEFSKAQSALQTLWHDQPFALGETFTLADVLMAQTLNWAQRFEMDVDENLLAYRDRMYARDACQQALQLVEA